MIGGPRGKCEKAVFMRREWLAVAVSAAVLAAGACGDSGGTAPAGAKPAGGAAAPVLETRWLRGLWANDIRDALVAVGLNCKAPVLENRTNVWACESGTPLVTYRVRFYGIAPGKIDYINGIVLQTGTAKDALPLRVFAALAGLHFEGADPVKAREWLKASLASGGTTAIGEARYKLGGDLNRRTFEIKASGSEW
jgi:hypothetical protein